MTKLHRYFGITEAPGNAGSPTNGGRSRFIAQRLRIWTDNELAARLEQEEIWAQTIWPHHEDVLTDLINAEINRRGGVTEIVENSLYPLTAANRKSR